MNTIFGDKRKSDMKKNWVALTLVVLSAISFAGGYFVHLQEPVPPDPLTCPAASGRYLLPRTFEPKTLFLSYDGDLDHLVFLRSAVSSVLEQRLDIDVNIIVPKGELESAYDNLAMFRQFPYKSFVSLILAPTDESLWVQDYLETSIDLASGDTQLLELPYWDRDGVVMPKFVALSKRWDFIGAPEFPDDETHSNADYGGNIEALPFGIVLIGESMAPTLQKHLQSLLPLQKLLPVNASWLENSHVDEVFTLLPSPQQPCGFAIGYASPGRAMEILNAAEPTDERLVPEFQKGLYLDDDGFAGPPAEEVFAHCLFAQNFLQCKQLVRANQAYEAQIQQTVAQVRQVLAQRCPGVTFVPFPQLFLPLREKKTFAVPDDYANALNPNVVNNLLVGRHIYYSQQPFAPFALDVFQSYQSLGLVPRPVVSNVLHQGKGGLHCASLMAHTCRQTQ
jgi:hypothetical protein